MARWSFAPARSWAAEPRPPSSQKAHARVADPDWRIGANDLLELGDNIGSELPEPGIVGSESNLEALGNWLEIFEEPGQCDGTSLSVHREGVGPYVNDIDPLKTESVQG